MKPANAIWPEALIAREIGMNFNLIGLFDDFQTFPFYFFPSEERGNVVYLIIQLSVHVVGQLLCTFLFIMSRAMARVVSCLLGVVPSKN